jgi:LCP family protein required for cell wall assembly
MTQTDTSETKQTESTGTKSLKIAVLVGFFIAAILTAYLTFVSVRDFVTSYEMTNLPGISISEPNPTPDSSGAVVIEDANTPLQPAGGPPPPEWDGANRVSILVMGLDFRDWQAQEGAPRTDTMLLLTVDPINRTAGMLTIPRDLWVNIPGGFDYGRINTAYSLGESYELPGGGPGLAVDTVEELLGVPIDFYAQVDFGAFVRFINEIYGVKINVPEKIKIDPLGDNNTKWLQPGIQNLPGDLALAYVRARKTEGGDFDRAERQQQVVLAIRNQILRSKMLPLLISKAPTLYNELASGLNTNLNLDQAIRLAWMATQIPEENIKRGSIGADQINFATSPDGGQQVLKPLSEKIRLLRDEIFTDSGAASPAAANMDPVELMQTEGARVAVLNGSYTPGIAARTTDYLKSLGVNVTQTDNAEKATPYTEITFYTGKPYTVKFLVELMSIDPIRIRHFYDPASPVDISVILGDNWAQNNPMPQ